MRPKDILRAHLNNMSLIACILLIAAVTAYSAGDVVRIPSRDELSVLSPALLSCCALPWSGVSFFTFYGVHSSLFFPLFALAVFFARSRGTSAVICKSILVLTIAITASALVFFTLRVGIPGDIGSIESLGAVVRLESIRNYRLILAVIIFSAGLILAFAQIPLEESWGSSALSFSLSAFLISVFCPVNTAEVTKFSPQLSISLDAALLFLLSLLLQNIVIKRLSARLSLMDGKAANRSTPIIFVLVGCYFLFSEI